MTSISKRTKTAPSMRLSSVWYGLICNRYQWPRLILHLPFEVHNIPENCCKQRFQIDVEIRPDVGDGASDIGWKHFKDSVRRGGHAAYTQAAIHHHNGDHRALEQVSKVVPKQVQSGIVVIQLVVDIVLEFFIGSLQFFLRGFQLLVGTLQFFIRGEHLFMSRLIILPGALPVLPDAP